ncbi:MAG: metal-dependent hydrolase [Phycisphaeraceae bacterium]|nr:metal-dependent hydrolase [Phycisphaeraceae bacterium]
MELTFLGHSGLWIAADRHSLVIDPFLTGNPLATHKPADVRCTHLALTHGHNDHVGDTVAIAKATGATVYAAFEITQFLAEQGVKKLEPMNPGGQLETPFGFIAFTQAFHSSSYNGRYMGQPCGIVVNIGGVTIYHCGDTGLFSDMKLIGEMYQPDIAAIPVGDRFTMGPRLGTKAAELIRPKVAIPIHYATFGALTSDISAFAPRGVQVKAMAPGEMWRYG